MDQLKKSTRFGRIIRHSTTEVQEEEVQIRARRHKVLGWMPGLSSVGHDLSYLLLPREDEALATYESGWLALTGTNPAGCVDCVLNLGDTPTLDEFGNFGGWWTWSLKGTISTLRKNTWLLWVPFLRRWLTIRERFSCLGYPTYEHLSQACGVPVWDPPTEISEASALSGNTMNVCCVGVCTLCTLACIREK